MATEFIIQLSLLGIVVGFAAGLLGVGGGGILVPMLTSMYLSAEIVPSHAVHLALGTSMASIITTTFSSAFSHYKNHNLDWTYIKAMVPLIIMGAISISFLVPFINTTFLAVFFSLFMFSISLKLFFNKQHISAKQTKIPPQLAGLGIGSICYAINGHISAEELANHQGIIGFVHIPSVIIISISGFLMAPVGVKLSTKLPVKVLKKIFAVLLVGLSIKMLMNVLL